MNNCKKCGLYSLHKGIIYKSGSSRLIRDKSLIWGECSCFITNCIANMLKSLFKWALSEPFEKRHQNNSLSGVSKNFIIIIAKVDMGVSFYMDVRVESTILFAPIHFNIINVTRRNVEQLISNMNDISWESKMSTWTQLSTHLRSDLSSAHHLQASVGWYPLKILLTD